MLFVLLGCVRTAELAGPYTCTGRGLREDEESPGAVEVRLLQESIPAFVVVYATEARIAHLRLLVKELTKGDDAR